MSPLSPSASCPGDLAATNAALLYLVYGYGTSNNRNVTSQQIGVTDPQQSLNWLQQCGYDSLNRLTSAQETVSGLPNGVTANNWNLADAVGLNFN